MVKHHDNWTTEHKTGPDSGPTADLRNPRLIVVGGSLLGYRADLGIEPVVIGRASDCTLSLPHQSISRYHCRVWLDANHYLIEDLGSTNRTYLNGFAIERAQLHDGDRIGIGNSVIKFFVGSSPEAHYHSELINLAIYDSLTGFFNRRYFRTLLDEEVARTLLDDRLLCLLMLDLDFFKALNDEHGHLIGDQVLSAVAKALSRHVPVGAQMGRLGGEEFGMLLRTPSLAEAVAVGNVLREAAQSTSVALGDRELRVSISIGVAKLEVGANASALLRAADQQLYRAKQAGRNCVVSALD